MADPKMILVLCTGNSARSILAETYLNHIGGATWRAVSAGSKPTGRVNPLALQTLAALGIPAPRDAHSKSWDVFTRPGSAAIDVVLTVCDNAANEPCPHFPGHARKIHLPFPDPAAVTGSHAARLAAFHAVFSAMRPQLDRLVADLTPRSVASKS